MILVTSFAGKAWCLKKHLQSIERLDCDTLRLAFYDDQDDLKFSQCLKGFIEQYPGSVYLSNFDLKHPRGSTNRVREIYNGILRITRDWEDAFYFFFEDDVEVGEDFLKTNISCLDQYGVVALSAKVNCRHIDGGIFGQAFHYKLEKSYIFPEEHLEPCYEMIPTPIKENGIEEVGSNSFSALIVKKNVIDHIELVDDYEGIAGYDIAFGGQLKDRGLLQLVNWGEKAKHYYLHNNEVKFV